MAEDSQSLIARARAVTAAEDYDIASRFPVVMDRAEGAWCFGPDGRRILDVTAASGSVLLGYRHPRITEALIEQVRNHGASFPTTITRPRIELAERLCARFPAAEKAVFFRTGSEATTAAIRLARAATGRPLVVSAGYHGWHDWHGGFQQLALDARQEVIHFGYSLNALARILEAVGGQVACVIVTPEMAWYSLGEVCSAYEMCHPHGIVFILDEVMTGLRYHPSGVNGAGAPADMITISKGLANGHSLAAVLGRRELIDCYDAAGLGGTYTRETTTMAAALAVLDVMDSEHAHEKCAAAGSALRDGIRDGLAAAGVAAWVGGPPTMFDVVFPTEDLAAAVYAAAFEQGVYFGQDGTQLVTAAYAEAEVGFAVEAMHRAAVKVAATYPEAAELGEDRRHEFAKDAFGGVFVEDERFSESLENVITGARQILDNAP